MAYEGVSLLTSQSLTSTSILLKASFVISNRLFAEADGDFCQGLPAGTITSLENFPDFRISLIT
jgi:hypothetical protein